jgi:hypothetical protein
MMLLWGCGYEHGTLRSALAGAKEQQATQGIPLHGFSSDAARRNRLGRASSAVHRSMYFAVQRRATPANNCSHGGFVKEHDLSGPKQKLTVIIDADKWDLRGSRLRLGLRFWLRLWFRLLHQEQRCQPLLCFRQYAMYSQSPAAQVCWLQHADYPLCQRYTRPRRHAATPETHNCTHCPKYPSHLRLGGAVGLRRRRRGLQLHGPLLRHRPAAARQHPRRPVRTLVRCGALRS